MKVEMTLMSVGRRGQPGKGAQLITEAHRREAYEVAARAIGRIDPLAAGISDGAAAYLREMHARLIAAAQTPPIVDTQTSPVDAGQVKNGAH